MDRRFVVVSGLPGSGKTTIARTLAPLLHLPLFDKDEFLERLFEARGVGDAVFRRELSRESDALLQASVSSSDGAVVTSFWHVPGMPADSGTPTEWLRDLSKTLVNVHCECPAEVSASRFVQRSRHRGHLDSSQSATEMLASIQTIPRHEHLGIGEPVVVATRQPVEPTFVLREVEAAFARCLTRLAADGGK